MRGAEFRIGADPVGVWADYPPPFEFTGHINEIQITCHTPTHRDPIADLQTALDEQ